MLILRSPFIKSLSLISIFLVFTLTSYGQEKLIFEGTGLLSDNTSFPGTFDPTGTYVENSNTNGNGFFNVICQCYERTGGGFILAYADNNNLRIQINATLSCGNLGLVMAPTYVISTGSTSCSFDVDDIVNAINSEPSIMTADLSIRRATSVANVPTLGEWGIIILFLLMTITSVISIQKATI